MRRSRGSDSSILPWVGCHLMGLPSSGALELRTLHRGGGRSRAGESVWAYSAAQYRRDTVERLARRYVARLRETVEHCAGSASTRHTLFDFPLWRMVRPE